MKPLQPTAAAAARTEPDTTAYWAANDESARRAPATGEPVAKKMMARFLNRK
jgi:hypothetical protein